VHQVDKKKGYRYIRIHGKQKVKILNSVCILRMFQGETPILRENFLKLKLRRSKQKYVFSKLNSSRHGGEKSVEEWKLLCIC